MQPVIRTSQALADNSMSLIAGRTTTRYYYSNDATGKSTVDVINVYEDDEDGDDNDGSRGVSKGPANKVKPGIHDRRESQSYRRQDQDRGRREIQDRPRRDYQDQRRRGNQDRHHREDREHRRRGDQDRCRGVEPERCRREQPERRRREESQRFRRAELDYYPSPNSRRPWIRMPDPVIESSRRHVSDQAYCPDQPSRSGKESKRTLQSNEERDRSDQPSRNNASYYPSPDPDSRYSYGRSQYHQNSPRHEDQCVRVHGQDRRDVEQPKREQTEHVQKNSDEMPPTVVNQTRYLDETQRSWLEQPPKNSKGQRGRPIKADQDAGWAGSKSRSRGPSKSAMRPGQQPQSSMPPYPADGNLLVEMPNSPEDDGGYDGGHEGDLDKRPMDGLAP